MMNFSIIKTRDFYSDLFEKKGVLQKYTSIKYKETLLSNNLTIPSKKRINIVELFPNYLTPKTDPNYNVIPVYQKSGYAINLSEFNTIDDFLKSTKTSFKKVTLRSVKRLESCFNISYKMFYGKIEESYYFELMEALYIMIQKRFTQRNGRNKVLENWDYYLQFAYQSIIDKKASLFVILNNNEPIEISLNFHCDNIMYSAISSFNLDYSKFSLGNIEIYKQLEWCLINNIVLFDMGYGDFEYKIRWSNYKYDFETHIISLKNSLLSHLIATYFKYKYSLINYLIKKNIKDKLYVYFDIFKKEEKKQSNIEYELIKIELLPTSLSPCDYNKKEFTFLKKPIFDFLYSFQENINDISIFKKEDTSNSYIIIGKKNTSILNLISE
ncbi:GNAT family N-acetyltransferase [Thalassobellus suaedae]|uniref:GNAT family N-acetyltransferase n=1 Tax=Thalassobellus suaedae TaxID=3074124 RepID=A0ABY9Y2W5_9FLAO|nr:GNAT family N-acetyltransferase [Flavobacteriaceae bacterium HL-DH10]